MQQSPSSLRRLSFAPTVALRGQDRHLLFAKYAGHRLASEVSEGAISIPTRTSTAQLLFQTLIDSSRIGSR